MTAFVVSEYEGIEDGGQRRTVEAVYSDRDAADKHAATLEGRFTDGDIQEYPIHGFVPVASLRTLLERWRARQKPNESFDEIRQEMIDELSALTGTQPGEETSTEK